MNHEARGFKGKTGIEITWCGNGCYGVYPKGNYTRVMRICTHGCKEELIGTVVMPNDPFSVHGGSVDGKNVVADDSNQGRIGQGGGPLNLYVGFHSLFHATLGNPRQYGYVFRLNGHLRLASP